MKLAYALVTLVAGIVGIWLLLFHTSWLVFGFIAYILGMAGIAALGRLGQDDSQNRR